MLYEITDKIVNRRLLKTAAGAERRHKEFNLDAAYMRNILEQEYCAYSGEKFSAMQGPNSLSLERWDNDKGYVKGNVVPVKAKYNHLRGCLTLEQLAHEAGIEMAKAKKLDRPETLRGKAKAYNESIKRIKANQEGRIAHLQVLLSKPTEELSITDRIQLDNIPKRIESCQGEIERLEIMIAKEMKKLKTDIRSRVKTANNASSGYGIIAKALLRFEFMNAHNYVRLKRGLPMIQKGE